MNTNLNQNSNHPSIILANRYQINLSNSSKLGQGSSAIVYQGTDLETHQPIAVKIIDTSTLNNQVYKYLYNMEINALQILKHKNIIHSFAILNSNQYTYIITQLCNGKTLSQIIQQQGPFNQTYALQILSSLSSAYQQLIKHKVAHRDLKTANVMLHNGQPKIIDFGYCQIEGYQKPSRKYNVGSPNYMAPQTFTNNIYNEKAQVWSLAVIFYEIITGKTLHDGRIKMPQNFEKLKMLGPQFPKNISLFSQKLILQCLNFDSNKRPSCKQIIQKISKHLSQKQQILPNQNNFSDKRLIQDARLRKGSDNIVGNNMGTSQLQLTFQPRKKSWCVQQTKNLPMNPTHHLNNYQNHHPPSNKVYSQATYFSNQISTKNTQGNYQTNGVFQTKNINKQSNCLVLPTNVNKDGKSMSFGDKIISVSPNKNKIENFNHLNQYQKQLQDLTQRLDEKPKNDISKKKYSLRNKKLQLNKSLKMMKFMKKY